MGAVCAHGIPVLGSFCDLYTPEQFVYYIKVLEATLLSAPCIKDVYMDFACKLKAGWDSYCELEGNEDLKALNAYAEPAVAAVPFAAVILATAVPAVAVPVAAAPADAHAGPHLTANPIRGCAVGTPRVTQD